MTQYEYQIGTTEGNLTNLESLPTPVVPPKPTYTPHAKTVDLGDGSVRGVGAPVVTWHWEFLTQPMRDQLKQFCLGSSAPIFIATYTKDNQQELAIFSGIMKWPIMSEEQYATRRLDFSIEFRELIRLTIGVRHASHLQTADNLTLTAHAP